MSSQNDDQPTSSVHVEPKGEVERPVEPPCADEPLAARIEALLLSTDRPLAEARLADVLGLDEKTATQAVRAAIDELNAHYEQTGRSFRAERLAGGWQLLTLPEFGPLMTRLHRERQQSRLSPAAVETLAIIAYRQPVLRAEIEAVRGVACGDILRGLLERRLIKIAGRAPDLGRPMLYGTTKEFLRVFGLSGTDDLPPVGDEPRQPRAGPADSSPGPAASEAPSAETPAPEGPAPTTPESRAGSVGV